MSQDVCHVERTLDAIKRGKGLKETMLGNQINDYAN